MFDQKDIGTATGLTVFSLGLILLLQSHSRRIDPRTACSVGLIGLGMILAIGTRVSMVAPITLGVILGVGLAGLCLVRDLGVRLALKPLAYWIASLLSSGVMACGALVVIYPLVFANPLSNLLPAIRQSGNFTYYPYRPSRTYVLEWLLIQTPLVLLFLSSIGTLAALLVVFRRCARRPQRPSADAQMLGLAVVLVQALAVPIFVIVVNSILYHSLRHLLFIFPALALLATMGVWVIIQWMNQQSTRRPTWTLRGVFVITLIGLLVPTIDQARLFPYAYAYFNPVARAIGIEGRWPTDYWRTSWRELYTKISTSDFAVCPDTIRFPDDTMYDWPVEQSFSCAYETKVNPFFYEPPNYDVSTGRFWFLRENAGQIYVPKNCRLHSRVSRPLGLGEITLSYLGHCAYTPSTPTVR